MPDPQSADLIMVTDQELRRLNEEVLIEAHKADEADSFFGQIDETVLAASQKITPEDYVPFAASDPEAMEHLYFALQEVQSDIPKADDHRYRSINTKLGENWSGAAAMAFAEHLATCQEFSEKQVEYYQRALGYVNACYVLALGARQSYQSIASKTIDSFRQYQQTQKDTRRQENWAVIKVVGGMAAGAMVAVGSGGVGLFLLGTVSGAVKPALDAGEELDMGGDSPLTIADAYRNAVDVLAHNIRAEVDDLKKRDFHALMSDVTHYPVNHRLVDPQPVTRYDDFQSRQRPSGGSFDKKADASLAQSQQAKPAKPSRITERLLG